MDRVIRSFFNHYGTSLTYEGIEVPFGEKYLIDRVYAPRSLSRFQRSSPSTNSYKDTRSVFSPRQSVIMHNFRSLVTDLK